MSNNIFNNAAEFEQLLFKQQFMRLNLFHTMLESFPHSINLEKIEMKLDDLDEDFGESRREYSMLLAHLELEGFFRLIALDEYILSEKGMEKSQSLLRSFTSNNYYV